MPPRRLTLVGEDSAAIELLESINERLGGVETGHALINERLGAPSQDGKAGTGLIGDVAELKTEVRGLVSLKNMGRGLVFGLLVAIAIAVAGVDGAFRLLAGSAMVVGSTH